MKNKSPPPRQARLVLEDGSEYAGYHFGKARSQAGEVVFTTAMTGCPQFLTDPSFRGQILVAACPLVGNDGAPVSRKTREAFSDEQGIPRQFQSSEVHVSGFVAAEVCHTSSHYSSGAILSAWLEKHNVPGIYGIDTRALALRIRDHGVMLGKILVEGSRDVTMDSGVIANPVAEVSCREIKTFTPPGKNPAAKIAVIDCGLKTGILRCLLSRNVEVACLPWNQELKGIEYDGLLISNGPGDPKACGKIIAAARQAFDWKKPVFGIGLGNQIMALAAGGDTFRLPFGHRGQAQPCVEAGTQRCYITSQNHGYAVRAESLPKGWEVWFTNVNDNTIEGIRSTRYPFSAVQFNPEGCPGPQDAEFVFDRFLEQVMASGKA